MTIENEASLLLIWLNQTAGSSTQAIVDVDEEPDWHALGDDRLVTLIDYLKAAGMVSNINTLASGTACYLTSRGVAEAERLVQARDNPRTRFDLAADRLIDAAMENYPTSRLELTAFIFSPNMHVLDSVLAVDELLRAVAYLEECNLVTVEPGDRRAPPRAITLTALGTECGFADTISVRTFVNEQQRSGDQWTVNVNGGTGIQVGPNNTQNNAIQNNTGPDLDQLAQFTQSLLGSLQTAEISEATRVRIVADAEALQAELTAGEPEPGRIRRAVERLKESAAEHLPALAWSMALNAVGIPTF